MANPWLAKNYIFMLLINKMAVYSYVPQLSIQNVCQFYYIITFFLLIHLK